MIDIELLQELFKCFMKSKDCIKAVTLIDRLLYFAGMAEAGRGTVCSNGFYEDISNQHQVQQYKSCMKSFL